uniref:Uncharacterized protein n=1 Tax=Physcomitrium patens TaxID=3218 RepID=A0A2K1JCV6_PHYPA|nr:hypothetical protein PHYPA_019639 [Physcomitrium patens]
MAMKLSYTRFEVEKFYRENNFELWQLKVKYFLIQQSLYKTLQKKPTKKIIEE